MTVICVIKSLVIFVTKLYLNYFWVSETYVYFQLRLNFFILASWNCNSAGEAILFHPMMPVSHFVPIIISYEIQLYEILSTTSLCSLAFKFSITEQNSKFLHQTMYLSMVKISLKRVEKKSLNRMKNISDTVFGWCPVSTLKTLSNTRRSLNHNDSFNTMCSLKRKWDQ